MADCFLCNERADISPYGRMNWEIYYKQAEIDIANGIYQKEAFPLVVGIVFDSFYNKNEVKTVMTDDFKTAKPITTPLKSCIG